MAQSNAETAHDLGLVVCTVSEILLRALYPVNLLQCPGHLSTQFGTMVLHNNVVRVQRRKQRCPTKIIHRRFHGGGELRAGLAGSAG